MFFGALVGHLRFVILFSRNNQHENTKKGMFYCIIFLNFLNKDQGVFMDPKRITIIKTIRYNRRVSCESRIQLEGDQAREATTPFPAC